MPVRFAKYEGLGNDFVVIERAELSDVSPAQAIAWCDRHLGVGADGVLLVDRASPSMRVINADGSVPEMCGNGLRCVVWHLARVDALPGGDEVVVQTGAGPHACRLLRGEGGAEVEVAMRAPSLAPADVPVDAAAPLVDAPFLEGLRVTAVSMGNPHAVTFDDVGARRGSLGPRVQEDARFPEGVNVGFARPAHAGFELAVYERGAGWTRACGTGACAAAVAAVETGRAERHAPLPIHLPGGTLTITVG
ncbi:MAG TPA: diaminopimelate epimerase, partial [Polyangiaceae bacterium LLY-WYZ-15_(1-7)]|nr:diaminopimelate epimerase [Polyangiaceae bacterium LLY-WYZ-15_(1-7)]